MTLTRTIRYQWLKFKRLQGDPRKLAWGMALGVFVGMTPTVPFHTAAVLILAPLLGISPVTAYLGIWVMNPVTIAPLYLAAYKVGQFLLFRGEPLCLPETFTMGNTLELLGRGGLALQVGGVILALPPAVISYFITLWAIQRYRQRQARKAAGGLHLSENPPTPTGPEA